MAVIDSSALIPLIKIGKLGLLKKIFLKVIIPEPVWEEVVIEGKKLGKPIEELEQGRGKWLTVLKQDKKGSVEEGTLESNDFIVFKAAKDGRDILVTNDASLYYYSLSQKVKAYWLTTLLLVAVKKKKIRKDETEIILLELVSTGGMHLKSDILGELLMIIRNL